MRSWTPSVTVPTAPVYEGPVRGEAWDGAYQSSCRYVGRVVGGMEADGYCTVEAKNRFYVGETLELLSP